MSLCNEEGQARGDRRCQQRAILNVDRPHPALIRSSWRFQVHKIVIYDHVIPSTTCHAQNHLPQMAPPPQSASGEFRVNVDLSLSQVLSDIRVRSFKRTVSRCSRIFIQILVATLLLVKVGFVVYMEYKAAVALEDYPKRFDPESNETADLIEQCDKIANAAETAELPRL